ncbi:MAG: hypothetical protein L6V93_18465 [Clostridiales bacterium]|nr:MAG: hypothetical protein L6V93_18465 [Clostridiales bacterium]
MLYDENMNRVNNYALSKGNKADGTLDTMACVKLEKGKTTVFLSRRDFAGEQQRRYAQFVCF